VCVVYVCVCVSTCVKVYVSVHVCLYVRKFLCVCARAHACVRKCVCMCLCMRACVRKFVCKVVTEEPEHRFWVSLKAKGVTGNPLPPKPLVKMGLSRQPRLYRVDFDRHCNLYLLCTQHLQFSGPRCDEKDEPACMLHRVARA
jgi:hypothetical protein